MTEEQFNLLLEDRYRQHLSWVEPWCGTASDGDSVDVCVGMRATAAGCINLQRRAVQSTGFKDAISDDQLLSDFIAVHWASLVEDGK